MADAARSDRKPGSFRFRHSEALLQSILDNASLATFLVGADGRLIYANPAFNALLGHEPDAPVSVRPEDLVHPDDLALAREEDDRLASGKIDSARAERRYLAKDGHPVWVLVSTSVLRDEKTGRLVYRIVQAVSIEGRKQAEAALAESKSRWNFALEGAGQGVWDRDFRTGEIFHSRMWKEMRGYEPADEVDSSQAAWLSRLHPDDLDRIQAAIRRNDAGETGFGGFEYRERRRDGSYVWILARGKTIEWMPDGTPARIIGTDTDISTNKMAESALAEEKERLRVTLQSIADGVISTDAAARITFMNAIAGQMTGWSANEAVGVAVDAVFHIVDDHSGMQIGDPVTECLATLTPVHHDADAVLVSRRGHKRDVRHTAAPVRTPGGKLMGAVLVFQDVTSGRAIQRKLAHIAMHDGLTGLPNRTAFERELDKAIEEARRESREHAICVIDLDRFKAVNDSGGHSAGDALLVEVAATIRAHCRDKDFAARLGGDEFALLLPDCTAAKAAAVAAGLIEAIARQKFQWGRAVHTIGASVGVAPITRTAGGLEEVVGRADAACYEAKIAGRNRVAIYDAGKAVGRERA